MPEHANPMRDEVLRLFVKHQPMLRAFAFTVVEDRGLVDDVLQEVAVYLSNHYEAYRQGTSFESWARKVTLLRSRELLHARKRERLLSRNFAETISRRAWERFESYGAERLEALSRCKGELSDRARRILELRYGESMPCEAIAGRLRLQVDSVYKTLCRIRSFLETCVRKRLAEERK